MKNQRKTHNLIFFILFFLLITLNSYRAINNINVFANTTNVEEDAEEVIEIANIEEFEQIRNFPDLSYKLVENIDFQNQYFTPISNFSGVLDGNFKKIKNIKINSKNENVGIFENLTGATIKNVGVENIIINNNNSLYVGAFAGTTKDSSIQNSFVSGYINVNTNNELYCGGFIGHVYRPLAEPTITNCFSNIEFNIDGKKNITTGGFVGYASMDGNLIHGFTYGKNVAKIHNSSSSSFIKVTNSASKQLLSNPGTAVGGIIAESYGGTHKITNSIFDGQIWVKSNNIFMYTGYIYGTNGKSENCFVTDTSVIRENNEIITWKSCGYDQVSITSITDINNAIKVLFDDNIWTIHEEHLPTLNNYESINFITFDFNPEFNEKNSNIVLIIILIIVLPIIIGFIVIFIKIKMIK